MWRWSSRMSMTPGIRTRTRMWCSRRRTRISACSSDFRSSNLSLCFSTRRPKRAVTTPTSTNVGITWRGKSPRRKLEVVRETARLELLVRESESMQRSWSARALLAEQSADVNANEAKWCAKASADADKAFHRAHWLMLAAELHHHSMVKATDRALYFSKHQLEMFKDLKQSSGLQAWDAKEDANTVHALTQVHQ